MPDFEVPTAQPTPTLKPAVANLRPSRNLFSSRAGTTKSSRISQSIYSVEAHEPKCAICHRTIPKEGKIMHVNRCWKMLRNAVCARKLASKREMQKRMMEEGERIRDNIEEMDNTRSVGLQSSLSTSSTKIKTNTPQVAVADLPLTSCVLCSKDLFYLDDIDAFHHRMLCMNTLRPLSCPICHISFTYTFSTTQPWQKQAIVCHLYECQRGGALSKIAMDDFEALVAAWSARLDLVDKVLGRKIGEKKDWSNVEHRRRYKAKRDFGRELGGGVYVLETSRLRKQLSQEDEKTAVPSSVLWERFRRAEVAVDAFPVVCAVNEIVPVVGEGSYIAATIENAGGHEPTMSFQHPPGRTSPPTSTTSLDAVLNATTRPPTPRNRSDLDESRSKLLNIFLAPSPESFVTLPYAIRPFPNIHFTCSPEADDDVFAPNQWQQTLINPCISIRIPHDPACTTTVIMHSSPVRLPSSDNVEGGSTQPLMLPNPYAHAIYFSNNTYIVFGEGVLAPSPWLCREEESRETSASANVQEEDKRAEDQLAPSNIHTPRDSQTPSSPAAYSTIHSSLFPSDGFPLSPCPDITFICPDERDEEIRYETYAYGPRGKILDIQRSNVQTVLDPHLTSQEQSEHNKALVVFGGVDELDGEE